MESELASLLIAMATGAADADPHNVDKHRDLVLAKRLRRRAELIPSTAFDAEQRRAGHQRKAAEIQSAIAREEADYRTRLRKRAEVLFGYDPRALDLLVALHAATAGATDAERTRAAADAAALLRDGAPIGDNERQALADLIGGAAKPRRGAPSRVRREERQEVWILVTWSCMHSGLPPADHYGEIGVQVRRDRRTVEDWFNSVGRCAALAGWRDSMVRVWKQHLASFPGLRG